MQDKKVIKYEIKESILCSQILALFQENYPDYPFDITGNYIEDLLYLYFSLKGKKHDDELNNILNSYNFNYQMSIHNAIYYLLGKRKELEGVNINPVLWPGVDDIKNSHKGYELDTKLGLIKVRKAQPLFSKTSSAKVFRKQLMGECHERTLDFLRENTDYQAVLSYMPNFFLGGHYHSYLEKDGCILDIASNAFYDDQDSIKKIFNGEVIEKVSYKKVMDDFDRLKKRVTNIPDKQKLLTLSLYYDIKRS